MTRALSALLCAGALAAAALQAGCAEVTTRAGAAELAERPVRVVATTNFIADLAEQVGGDRVEVTGLMGPGVDPHLYKATAGDVRDLIEADLILYGGLELEGKMGDVFERLEDERAVVAVTRDMPSHRLRSAPAHPGRHDPHVWFDVDLWRFAVGTTAAAFRHLDPAHAATYDANAAAYDRRLARLDAWAREQLDSIPPRRRVLVTSHDAFQYMGARYGLEVVAIQGISTATEATTADVERVADVIAERGLRSVFVESSVPPQTIEAVLASAARRGRQAVVGAELYADAAGERGTPEGTYVGMVRHNVTAIAEGLR